ncbi:LysR family transcriptional regulator [Desulfitobacterium sp. LBE]|uniref:HTH lysR-type domain-containing protein n=5 Tax=root TaxID=1 RepID=Q24MI6_DESHY|nr:MULTISPECIES: LysR family transcriptional regulator [Desulfitobacterium]ACL22861.1 transcriptional regulator, LysR family [Desulfitobacterium hafniense DCB-2]EHL05222.1 LysR substrate binding domain protein [Desulfitobacterium hafniense DP7]KTE93507.1 transcriptional regulator [Desulfitobacterium hafniense]MEA5025663.1 LysR family transcriptional regulator [Desulfitobacterium hafniense]TWH59105.1 LysR family transcriptional regulator [Desulfitobacterium sp. LBE]
MRLEQLYHLVEVAKYNSISIAAERIYITQPAVSASISKLEDELGVLLFKRTTKGAYPTDIGQTIIEAAEEILQKVDFIKELANTSALAGNVTIATIPSMCDKIMPHVLSFLKEAHPGISVSLHVGESIQVLNHIQSGTADIGIVIMTEEIQEKNIYFEKLFHDEFLIYVGKNSPLANKQSVTLQEALEYPVVAYNDEFSRNNGGITSLLKKYSSPKISFRFDNFEMIKRTVSQGTFISFFPKFMSKNDVYQLSHEIVPIAIQDVTLDITIALIWAKRHVFSAAEKEFIAILKSFCEETIVEDCS